MSDATDRFNTAAAQLGIEVRSQRFPSGTRTAVDAANAIGCELDQIVKSLVFIADDAPVLALTAGGNRVDEQRLAEAIGAGTVRKASADEVREATGFAIGGTPPFGHPERIRTVIDPTLLEFDEVWAAAGTPHDVFPVHPGELARAADGETVDVTER